MITKFQQNIWASAHPSEHKASVEKTLLDSSHNFRRKKPCRVPLTGIMCRFCSLGHQWRHPPISHVVHTRVKKWTRKILQMGIVTNELDVIFLGSTAFSSRQRLGTMLANKESMATQLSDPSPSARVGVQICLEDNKPTSLSIYEGRGRATLKPFNHQQSTTTFN